MTRAVVTFDLFSALTDSRRGASATFAALAAERGWEWTGVELYDRWDAHNKRLQRDARPPLTFHDLSARALALAYVQLGVPATFVESDLGRIEESVAEWPLWPDVVDGMGQVSAVAGVGILSNVDDALVRTTRAFALVDPDLVLTSQMLGAYKPSREIYHAARQRVAPRPLIHVAASARDTRGAREAGLPMVRLARPGHSVDRDGPLPPYEVDTVAAVAPLVQRLQPTE